MDAEEVLPASTMSSATLTFDAPSRRAIASTMRRLAWCGMNAASSAGSIPAFRQASSATGASAVVAQRKTAWPSWPRNPVRVGIVMSSTLSPALPQATGPTPTSSGVRAGPTTAAPAPSAKMIAVDRSSGST